MKLPDRIEGTEVLDRLLADPSDALREDRAALEGDFLILGGGGTIGPSLALLARNAAPGRRVMRADIERWLA